MEIVSNNDIDSLKWDALLKNALTASPFQTLKFYEFFKAVDNCDADVFAVVENDIYVSLVVVTKQQEKGVKSFFSKRGIIYGGPIYLDGEALETLNGALRKIYKSKLIYLESRSYFDFNQVIERFTKKGWNFVPWLNFQLDTSSEEIIRKNISSSRLRQIKKAKKNGAYWKEAESIDHVKAFYQLLENLYKNQIKKPLLPISFFLEFYKQDVGKFLLVFTKDDKLIGGIMCPLLEQKTIYELYICGLDSEYKDLYPSVMATWAAMEYALQNGISMFDFMGAGQPDKAYGVREFKARFGGELVEYGRFLLVLKPIMYNIGKIGLNILSRLKK